MDAWLLRKQAPVETHPLERMVVPTPMPESHELLVRVRVCGVCRTDLHIVEGDLPLRRWPVIPGHQIVGEVWSCGADVEGFDVGDRVGIAWLRHTCGVCRFCAAGRENLCERAEFTGWSADGGFAEYAVVPAEFAYRLPDGFPDLQAAPLLCAGIIGYRALMLTGLGARGWSGARLGLYGFGAAGHVAIQLARAWGAEAYVSTRDRARHQVLAAELGAAWVGDVDEPPPVPLDAAIIFAPAGQLVPAGLAALDKGGTLVLAGIHMSAIPEFPYGLIYGERIVRSVANNTRADAVAFLAEAARIPVRTHVHSFDFDAVDEALIALKHDAIRGAGVVVIQ